MSGSPVILEREVDNWEELKNRTDLEEPFVLLETLLPEHFQHVHLPGARNGELAWEEDYIWQRNRAR
jgi:hypothetical protein